MGAFRKWPGNLQFARCTVNTTPSSICPLLTSTGMVRVNIGTLRFEFVCFAPVAATSGVAKETFAYSSVMFASDGSSMSNTAQYGGGACAWVLPHNGDFNVKRVSSQPDASRVT